MWRSLYAVVIAAALVVPVPQSGLAQTSVSEVEQLKQELRRIQERLQKLEQQQATPAPAPAPVPAAAQVPPPPVAPRAGEREITLEREHPFEVLGLPKPEFGGVRFSGFFVGSANYCVFRRS